MLSDEVIKRPKWDGHDLGVGATYRIVIKDKDGNIESDTGEQKAKSFVANFLYLLYIITTRNTQSMTDNTSTGRSPANASDSFAVNAASADNTFGCQVGTGTGAVTVSDVKLGTLIAHGTSSGTLSYGAQSTSAPVQTSSDCRISTTRTLTNSSGGTITVTEIGLSMKLNTFKFLCLRESTGGGGLSFSSQVINNGSNMTLTYTIIATA